MKVHIKYKNEEMEYSEFFDFKWDGSDFVLVGKAFNPTLEKVLISPYDMKIKGVSKSGMLIPLYGKYVSDVFAIVQMN